MSLQDALAALAALPISGVNTYGVGALPQTIQRAALPALLVVPFDLPDLPTLPSDGLTAATFTQGSTHAQISVTHLLLLTTTEAAQPMRATLPALLAHVDAVLAAYAADPLLGDTLAEPLRVRVALGVYAWGGSSCCGCAFQHQWLLRL
ncbi:MAG: hypothetical protein SNJ54_13720 [Anaerolineae bacterium]